jgi:Abortive infection C-terminus
MVRIQVPQPGILLKSLRICSFLARRNSLDRLSGRFTEEEKSMLFLLPELSGAAEVRQSLTKTLNGLHTAVQGICELRNRCGFASHGSGNPRPAMASVQALLAAQAADAIIGMAAEG